MTTTYQSRFAIPILDVFVVFGLTGVCGIIHGSVQEVSHPEDCRSNWQEVAREYKRKKNL